MSNDVPAILYKYRAFSINSLDSLINDTVYLADPVSFNDPFDCQPSVVDDLDEILILRDIATELKIRSQHLQLVETSTTVQDFIQHQRNGLINNMFNGENPLAIEDKLFNENFEQYKNHIEHCDAEYYDFYSSKTQELIIEIDNELKRKECDIPNRERQSIIEMYEDLIKTELVVSRNVGVLSLAEDKDCPLMWAHYADDHQGFCCGYKLSDNPQQFSSEYNIKAVDYEGNRTVFTSQILQLVQDFEDVKGAINNAIYYVKAKKWEYENEYRMIGKPGLQKSPFILDSVYFGLRCKESVKFSIMSALANRDSTVQFYQMTEVKGNFDLKPEPITLTDLKRLPRN